MFAQT